MYRRGWEGGDKASKVTAKPVNSPTIAITRASLGRTSSSDLEPRSDDEDDIWAGTPSPNFHVAPAGGRLATTYDLACSRPYTRRIFGGIGFRAWSLPAPEQEPYH
ncbi:hypothetical protein AVEN_26528-1 [Araneus ventricosus]|uniref:Uncharacterized protein n=1 Tax=Araneus ventricosus TaxID=182803 RepID=A0A4Y2JYC2_ARAVE|nr:hypothetical protein AVEN_26528-1 [Araneus ventricosus]